MTVITRYIELTTSGNAESKNITPELIEALEETGFTNGVVTVFVPGATGGVTTVEFEPGLVRDLEDLWERIAPSGKQYHHDDTWGDGNGYAHVRAALLGPSLTVPLIDGSLVLGTWQQIVLVDFDNRPRDRKILVHISGI